MAKDGDSEAIRSGNSSEAIRSGNSSEAETDPNDEPETDLESYAFALSDSSILRSVAPSLNLTWSGVLSRVQDSLRIGVGSFVGLAGLAITISGFYFFSENGMASALDERVKRFLVALVIFIALFCAVKKLGCPD